MVSDRKDMCGNRAVKIRAPGNSKCHECVILKQLLFNQYFLYWQTPCFENSVLQGNYYVFLFWAGATTEKRISNQRSIEYGFN